MARLVRTSKGLSKVRASPRGPHQYERFSCPPVDDAAPVACPIGQRLEAPRMWILADLRRITTERLNLLLHKRANVHEHIRLERRGQYGRTPFRRRGRFEHKDLSYRRG